MNQERREHQRTFVFARITDNEENFLGYVINLSQGGVMMLCLNNDQQRDSMELIIKCPYENQMLEFPVSLDVVWRKNRGDHFQEIGATFDGSDQSPLIEKIITYFQSITTYDPQQLTSV